MTSGKPKAKYDKIRIPRPGHADLVGVSKYDLDDIRNSIERSSARETALPDLVDDELLPYFAHPRSGSQDRSNNSLSST